MRLHLGLEHVRSAPARSLWHMEGVQVLVKVRVEWYLRVVQKKSLVGIFVIQIFRSDNESKYTWYSTLVFVTYSTLLYKS